MARPGPHWAPIPHTGNRRMYTACGWSSSVFLVGFRSSLSLGAFMLAISISRQSGFFQLISVFRPVPQTALDPICLEVSSSCPPTISGLSGSVCPSHDRATLIQLPVFFLCLSLPPCYLCCCQSPHPTFSGCKPQLLTSWGHLPGPPVWRRQCTQSTSHPPALSPPHCGFPPGTSSLKT